MTPAARFAFCPDSKPVTGGVHRFRTAHHFARRHRVGDAGPWKAWTHTLRCIDVRYTIWRMAVLSFKCSDTQALHQRVRVLRFVSIESVARRKLDQLDAATQLRDMAAPPGNRLEALQGNRKGQHSVRINDQWRICFVWTDQGPKNVDYH